jgi:hydrogenase maturation protein HypF
VDDSLVRVMMGRAMVLRRARGYAPLPIHLTQSAPPVLAVGAQAKNAMAMAIGHEVFLSQHIGDLETVQAFHAFEHAISSFQQLYEHQPMVVACDAHPGYRSTQFAHACGLPVISVQHHYAHVLACMAENELEPTVLGVAWDGAGDGLDGTLWGGEFLRITPDACERVAHLRAFRLPGGAKAIREPRRAALGLLYEIFGDDLFEMTELAPRRAFSAEEQRILQAMLQKNLNAPVTSSAGRLCDAVAAITGLRQEASFEGQAAMELEFALDRVETNETYSWPMVPAMNGAGHIKPSVARVIDWEPMVRELLEDVRRRAPVSEISARFHNTLVAAIVTIAQLIGEDRVVLTGGCFQNKYLTETAVRRLRSAGFHPYWHQRVPPNDGGIALGQAVAASRSAGAGEPAMERSQW